MQDKMFDLIQVTKTTQKAGFILKLQRKVSKTTTDFLGTKTTTTQETYYRKIDILAPAIQGNLAPHPEKLGTFVPVQPMSFPINVDQYDILLDDSYIPEGETKAITTKWLVDKRD